MSEDIKIKHGSLQELKNIEIDDGVIYFAKDDNFLNGKIYYDNPSGEGRINVSGVGYDISGQTIDGYIAGLGAEIFNDYSEREYVEDNYGNIIAFCGNVASGDYSHAEGYATTASESCAHAEGWSTITSGQAAHAEGYNTKASGDYSHAEGYNVEALGEESHAEGHGGMAKGTCSHVEGQGSDATGYGSHAEGGYTQAINNYSHSEGYNTKANGESSHAEGAWTIASGNNSHAGGIGTKATGDNQTVIGEYNIEDPNSLFIIGNGTDEDTRSNAFVVDQDGSIYVNDKPMFSRGLRTAYGDCSIVYSGGQALFLTSGESAANIIANLGWVEDPSKSNEHLYIVADTAIEFLPNRNSQSDTSYGIILDANNCLRPILKEITASLGTSVCPWSSAYFSGTVTAKDWTTTSDKRLKEHETLENLSQYLEIYDHLNPVLYYFKNDSEKKLHIGFFAQDVEENFKNQNIDSKKSALIQTLDLQEPTIDCPDGKQYGLNYNELHGLHTLKNQQQDARISELEDKVSNLENELAEIKTLLLKNNIS